MSVDLLLNCSDPGLATTNLVSVCQYVVANAPVVTTCSGLAYFDTASMSCLSYISPEQAAGGALGNQLVGAGNFVNTGNTAWMLAASALVMIMTPGVGLFYAGLSGQENAGNTILMSFGTMCVVTVQWYLIGYSLAFGPGTPGFGSLAWGAFTDVGLAPSAAYGSNIPHVIFAAFQCMFAQITPALISGAVIGRMKFSSFMIFVFLWATFVYDPIAHWVWSYTVDPTSGLPVNLGWLGKLGALDFAGGTVIHISSGSAALAAAIVLGPRKNKTTVSHSSPMTVIGATLLWFGWFGFNAGSANAASGVASQAFWNTHLATAAASLSWMLTEQLVQKAATPQGASAGAVAGLVAITPACGFVNGWAALIIGIVVSPICYGAALLKARYGPDDTLDSFAVHAVGGAVGAFCTGLFATEAVNGYVNGAFFGSPIQLGYQMAAITTSFTLSFFGTIILMLLLKYTIGIRISEEAESEGLDASEHGYKRSSDTKAAPAVATSNPKYES